MKRLVLVLSILAFSTSGCGIVSQDNVKGKFAFGSTRDATPEKTNSHLYILKNGKLKKISDQYGSPVWSKAGVRLYCTSWKGIGILNDEGEQINFIKTPYKPISFDVSDDEKTIVYSAEERIDKQTKFAYLYIYDVRADEHKKIFAADENYFIHDVQISPNGQTVLCTIGSWHAEFSIVYTIDINGNKDLIWKRAMYPSWFPDGENILLDTTVEKDGVTPICKAFGALIKVNLKTMKHEIVKEVDMLYSDIKLSQDGKYIYYSRPYGKGKYIAVAPLNNLKKEIQITKPIYRVTKQGVDLGYSQDFFADWYQGT